MTPQQRVLVRCAGSGPHVLTRVLGPDDRPGPAFTTLQVVCCVSVIMLNGCLSSQVMSIRRLLYLPTAQIVGPFANWEHGWPAGAPLVPKRGVTCLFVIYLNRRFLHPETRGMNSSAFVAFFDKKNSSLGFFSCVRVLLTNLLLESPKCAI